MRVASGLSQKSDETSASGPKPVSLARHIFLRTAFPIGIVVLCWFSLLDQFVRSELNGHLRSELVAWDDELQTANRSGAERAVQTLARAIQPKGGSIADQLKRFADPLGVDVVAVYNSDRKPLLTLRRDGTIFRETTGIPLAAEGRTLTEIDGQYYMLTSTILRVDGKPQGWISAGRNWLREMPLSHRGYALTKQGKVVETAGLQGQASLKPGDEVNQASSLLVRSTAAGNGDGLAIYIVRSPELLANPLLAGSRLVTLVGAILSILGALTIALFTGRAVSRPLRNITESCLLAQAAGTPSEIQLPYSRIDEVNNLGQTLQAAVRSIDAGQHKLTQAYFQFMGAIVALLDARDTYTAGHSHRVSAYSEALARDFGLPQDQIEDIRVGALLHDIGKIGVPDEVLRKHDRLTKEEFELMKQHPTIGRKVLEQVGQFEKYLDAVELHHENLDGTGYPRGLRGEQIPISARIVKVADVYDALSTDRPYRKKMTAEEVRGILREGAGKHFDRFLVEIFLTRTIPSIEQRSGLNQLYVAVGESIGDISLKKAIGA